MTDKYKKYFIVYLLFIGILTTITTITTFNTENTQYKELILDAVLSDNIVVTKFLIKHDANINCKYEHNHTLLHSAALYGDIKMVKLLVNNGAKLYKNDFGLSAIDSARDYNNSDVVQLLVRYYDNLK